MSLNRQLNNWIATRNDRALLDVLLKMDTTGEKFFAKISLMKQFDIPYDRLTDNEKMYAEGIMQALGEVVRGFGISVDEITEGLQ